VLFAATDPVAAWGGVQLLHERHGLEATAVTGPDTDNAAGSRIIEQQTGVPCCNARADAAALGRIALERLHLGRVGRVA
jgi:hypothetical protein